LHVVEDPAGLAVVARPDCGGFHRSFADGVPLTEQVDALLELPQLHPRRVFRPEQVVVLPTAAVSLGDWMHLEPHLLASIQPAPPGAAVVALRARLYELLGREVPAADPARYEAVLQQLFEALVQALHGPSQSAGDDYRGRLVKGIHQALHRARQASHVPDVDATAQAYLTQVLRADVLGKQFQSVGGLPFGLGLHLLTVELTRRATDASPAGADDLGPTLSAFRRLSGNRNILTLLRSARPALGELFVHATAEPPP
jgi:hypothetical protein